MGTELLQSIELLVDPKTAQKIMQDGIAEVVLRQKDKKFKSFCKAKLAKSNASSEAAQKIMDTISHSKASDSAIAQGIHKALEGIDLANNNLMLMDSSLKDISTRLMSVFKLSNAVKMLSFINIGLTAANLAVNVAGFIYIANQMKGLSNQVKHIAADLGKIKDISVEEMRSECERLYLDYNSIVTKIHDGDDLSRDSLELYLKTAKPFISKLIRLVEKEAVDIETLLNMIFTLLPAYTSVLCMFLRAYYFEKLSTPLNYDNFLELYQNINDNAFRTAIQDYYITERQFCYRDVLDIMNVQLFSVFGERLEIEDQLKLIESFNTAEEYEAFERRLEEAVEKELNERAEEIASNCGAYSEECRSALLATA